MPRLRVIAAVVVCLLCGELLHADVPAKFTNLSVFQGLSQNTVWCILRDRQGFLWFGTDDGLNKFDGYQFLVYRNRKNDSTSIGQNTIHSMLQDRNGLIWLATSMGIDVYDPVRDVFRHLDLGVPPPKDEPRLVITSLAEDAKGNIWAGSHLSGVFKISSGGAGIRHYFRNPADSTSLAGTSIRTMYVDKAGTVWIGIDGGGLSRYVESTDSFVNTVPGKKDNQMRNPSVSAFFEDSKGRFWIGTLSDGIALYDRASGRCRYYVPPVPVGDYRMDTLTVLTILEDHDGRILYGTYGAGLKLLDPETGAIESWRNDLRDPNSLGSNFIISMYRDEAGCLWMGTYTNGVCKYDPHGEHFHAYRNEIPHTTLFTDNNMRIIYRDAKGVLWIGTSRGMNIFNPKTGICEQYRSSIGDRKTLSDNYVSSILEDSKGRIWVGTRQGLNYFDRKTKRFTRLADIDRYPRDIVSTNIRMLIEDHLGLVWIATQMGLVSYDRKSDAFTLYRNTNDPRTISSSNVRSLFEDHTGTIWIGTYGGGLNRFDRATGAFTRYMHDPKNPQSISSDLAAPIAEDRNGILWVGTYGGGVNRFDTRTGVFTSYTESDGLTNNTIFGIEVDGKNNIWITTNRGVSRFDPATNVFRNYTAASGLQGEEFNLNCSFKDKDGTLFFGGNFGFNMFHPDLILDNAFVPPVYITSMSIFNRPVRLDSAMTTKKTVVLSYDENSISFDFVALNFRKSELNQYKYMLEGFDREWIYSGAGRKASYTNLLPGEYVFRVMGSNNDGVWNTTGATLYIIVKPPFWRTWWAYVGYALVLGGSLAGGFQYLQRRQRRQLLIEQQRHEAEVVRQKNIKLKEANDEILRQQETLKERNEQIEKANRELQHQVEQREVLLSELKAALENVKTLGGLIPICSSCKKIRDDEGYWNILETYLIKHSDAQFSHGICPDCAEKLYPQYARRQTEKQQGGAA